MLKTLILALAVCYRSRLTDLRSNYYITMIERTHKLMHYRYHEYLFQILFYERRSVLGYENESW